MDYTPQIANLQYEPNPYESLKLDMPRPVPPIRVQVGGEVLDMGTP